MEGTGRLRKAKGKGRFEPRKVDSLEEAQLEIQELNKSLNRQTPIRCVCLYLPDLCQVRYCFGLKYFPMLGWILNS